MNKVIYNACYGGFNLSEEAVKWLMENARDEIKEFLNKALDRAEEDDYTSKLESAWCALKYDFNKIGIQRHDKDLIACIEALGCGKASGFCSSLAIANIEGNMYRIDEYDGNETVIEPNQEDYIIIT